MGQYIESAGSLWLHTVPFSALSHYVASHADSTCEDRACVCLVTYNMVELAILVVQLAKCMSSNLDPK